MRKILLSAVTAALILIPATAAQATNDIDLPGVDVKIRVALCHNIEHNPHVIIVDDSALEAHLAHGDTLLGTGFRKDLKAEFGDDGTSCAKNGTDGQDGTNGTDGKDGTNGVDGKDGANGLNGKDGVNGTNGKDADMSRVEQLERIVTELNNRLFILEHAAPAEAPVAATPEAARSHGELPHTGSSTMPILFIGGMLTLLGFALRRAVRMNRG